MFLARLVTAGMFVVISDDRADGNTVVPAFSCKLTCVCFIFNESVHFPVYGRHVINNDFHYL